MKKAINYIHGLVLLKRNFKALDPKIFQGKRIAIVGPADSAFGTQKGKFIDDFDWVVRVNRSPYLVDSGLHREDIGTRTDVLFHSFYENDESGGGVLDLKMYSKQGLKYLINPRNNRLGFNNTLVFYRKYLKNFPVFTLPKDLHKQIIGGFEVSRPTIGYMALMTLLYTDFQELYITGFTFYRTDFGPGYRDHIRGKEEAKKFIQKMGIHEIELEYKTIAEEIAKSTKKIHLDPVLQRILIQDNFLKAT